MARPRKYADDAARQAAHRARYWHKTIRLEEKTGATIERLAEELDAPATEVIASLIKFALLNRNWHQLGLFGKKLPQAEA